MEGRINIGKRGKGWEGRGDRNIMLLDCRRRIRCRSSGGMVPEAMRGLLDEMRPKGRV